MLTLVAPNFVNKLFFSMPVWHSVAPDKKCNTAVPYSCACARLSDPQKNKGKKRRFDRAVVINKSLLNIIKHDPILTEAQSERRFVFPP